MLPFEIGREALVIATVWDIPPQPRRSNPGAGKEKPRRQSQARCSKS